MMNRMPDRPDVAASLIAIHMVITRGIDVTIEKSESFAREGFENDTLQKGFVDYVTALIEILDAHHLSEDEIAFPALREKLPDAPYAALHSEHLAMLPVLEQIRAAADRVAAGDRPAAALNQLATNSEHLEQIWHPHIATEEENFSMAVLAHAMTQAEQEQLVAALGADSSKRLKQPFKALPFILYNLPPEERAYFMITMPPQVIQELVPHAWKDLWAPMRPFLLDAK